MEGVHINQSEHTLLQPYLYFSWKFSIFMYMSRKRSWNAKDFLVFFKISSLFCKQV